MRGFIAPLSQPTITTETGFPVWDATRFPFLEDGSEAPPTVNPSLWRQSQLCLKGGLFKVVDRLYQVRNADISNLTIIEGDSGLILVDPLISTETSRGGAGAVLRAPAAQRRGRGGPLPQPRRPLRRRQGGRRRSGREDAAR